MHSAYETVIGIEVHVQLATRTKIFCACPVSFAEKPNSAICVICSGQPGVLPILNESVVESALKIGLATQCTIAPISQFARKHYFYPDLPKNYQITQSDFPICTDGHIVISGETGPKKIRIMRIHMEEDAGKNMHSPHGNESFVDFNRAGTPLLEIVSHPDISSASEAKEYLKALHGIVTSLGIGTGNMEEGSFRADTNISVRKKGESKLGTKVELKNINSFKFIGDAIEFETARQIKALEKGERIIQETRLWDTKERITISMRSKEEAADYRYFPDPDLPTVVIDEAWLARIKKNLPELPAQKKERFMRDHALSDYEATILVDNPDIAEYFERARALSSSPHLIKWILRELIAAADEHKKSVLDFAVTPEKLTQLISLVDSGAINNRAAQEIFAEMAVTSKNPSEIMQEKNLAQVGDSAELEKLVLEIIAQNPSQADEYRAGKERMFGFFVGQAMAKTKGRGNPQILSELFKKHLRSQ